MPTSLASFINSVRELTFDRFVTPTFFVKAKDGYFLTIDETGIKILTPEVTVEETDTATVEDKVVDKFPFAVYKTFQDIYNAFIVSQNRYILNYTSTFISTEPSNTLFPMLRRPIGQLTPVYRRNYFSDYYLKGIMKEYFEIVMDRNYTVEQIEGLFTGVDSTQVRHMALWVAYHAVDKRRIYELSSTSLGQSSDGESGFISTSSSPGQMTVQIGDVFTLNEQGPQQDIAGLGTIGQDNVLGDHNTFWYRLQLHLRDRIEQLFGDTSLRKDTVIQGNITLEKLTNHFGYFDSYPYTLSPGTRNILSNRI
jgi:hypothetical protein